MKLKILSVALLIFVLCGCALLPVEEELLPPDLLLPAEVVYTTAPVTRGTIQSVITDQCTVASAQLYDLTFGDRAGYLADINVNLNRSVNEGDILARLETDILDIDIAKQRLNISKIRQNISSEVAKSELTETNFTIRQLQLELEAALIMLEYMEEEEYRGIDIIQQQQAIEKIELQIAGEIEKMILDEQNNAIRTNETVRQLQLDLEIAQKSLAQMEDELAKSVIIAPIDGEIVFIGDFRIGDLIPARTPVVTIADQQQLQFTYNGSEVQHIMYGMEMEILINDIPYPATVSMTPQTVPQEERERYRNTVLFTLDSPEDVTVPIRIGSRLPFRILLQEKEDVIVVPREHVKIFMGQYYVQVLEDGMRVDRDLDVGIVTNREVDVLRGVSEGDLIITGTE